MAAKAVEFGGDVVDVLEADGEADELGEDAAFAEVFVGELGVGGGSRVDDEGLGVADVRQEREDFAVNEDFPLPQAAPYARRSLAT